MTHYLVDYENVHENGMKGIRNLKGDCTVHIFYTFNACRIKMDSLIVPDNVMLHFVRVSAGKQQADMHIVSFLGFLIGREKTDDRYVIVSIDRDYDKTVAFWNSRAGSGNRVCRQERIENPVTGILEHRNETRVFHKPAGDKNTEIQFAQPKKESEVPRKNRAQACGKAVRSLIAKLKSQGIKRTEAEFAVQAMLENRYRKNYKQRVYNELVRRYGTQKGKRIYYQIKDLLPKQSVLANIA